MAPRNIVLDLHNSLVESSDSTNLARNLSDIVSMIELCYVILSYHLIFNVDKFYLISLFDRNFMIKKI